MTWSKLARIADNLSYLLTEAGEYLLQEASYKIVISYGWDDIGREVGIYTKTGKTDGMYTKTPRTEG